MSLRFVRWVTVSLKQFTAVLMLVLLPASLAAQSASQPVFRVNTRIVILDVVVTDRKGKVVNNLSKNDFTIYEDKEQQNIRTFEPPSAHVMPTSPDGKPLVTSSADLSKIGNAPVTILVLDELNTAFPDMAYARYSLQKYLNAQPEILNQPTELLVASNTKFQLLQDYTQKRADVLAALKAHFPEYPWKLEGSGKSGPGAAERIAQTLSSLLQISEASRGTPGRKNIVWVGVNAPGISLMGIDPDTEQQVTAIARRVTQTLLAARVTVFYINPTSNSSATTGVLVPGDDADSTTFVDSDPFGSDIDFDQFAPATGGQIFMSRNDVNNEIATSIDNGASYYTLSYSPTNHNEDAAKYRNIKIKLSDPNLIATTRGGYYPEPDNANNMVLDTSLNASQRKSALQMALSDAVWSTLSYNGLKVTAQKSDDKKFWHIAIPTRDLSWKPRTDGTLTTEVTAIVATFDDSRNNSTGKYRTIGKSKMLGHVAHELVAARKPDQPTPDITTFDLPVEQPAGTSRFRIVMRDAFSGKTGTADIKP
ncbi:MAG: VWA domain-containing protein [Acidobacteriaceae bacterium]|jgi:VWFA-related protein|nr:VWA domain-containing protein [Acidobacteriaceae bacterium]